MKQQLTLSVKSELIKKIKKIAIDEGTSVSGLFEGWIEARAKK